MDQDRQHVIATAGLTKIFRDFWFREKVTAVSDLDIEIYPKEVFGLLGPNGSGKSTTIKMALGLMFPTRGRIAVFGHRPTDVAITSRIGFLPEETYLYPFLDARETLDYYGRLFHQPRRQRLKRIDMLLDMVGLSAVAYRRIGEYSKGMKRLIGMAQALINDPDLLILDEPTSGLDPNATRHFKDLVRILADRGKTVVLSSHMLADVEDVCDRVCVLYGGRVRAMGPVADLLTQNTLTQITTSQLDAATLEAVRNVLLKAGHDIKDVTAPRDRLESVFLKIVADAQAGNVATGGAAPSGTVAEFLRQEEPADGRAVIETLVTAAQPAAAAPEVPIFTPPPVPQPQRDVLDSLVESASAASPPPVPVQEAPAPAAPAVQADRDVLNELLTDADNRHHGEA